MKIIGIDTINDYYDVRIKEYRLQELDEIARKTSQAEYVFLKDLYRTKSLSTKIFCRI